MPRKLRYSERKRLAETGSLGPLQDEPSEQLRNVIAYIYREPLGTYVGLEFDKAVHKACIEAFGWTEVDAERIPARIMEVEGEEFLDLLEILVEEGMRKPRDRLYAVADPSYARDRKSFQRSIRSPSIRLSI